MSEEISLTINNSNNSKLQTNNIVIIINNA